MPKHYKLHAMGIQDAMNYAKRNLPQFIYDNNIGRTVLPKQLQITEGSGAQRRLTTEERKQTMGEGMHTKAPRKVNPISFKF